MKCQSGKHEWTDGRDARRCCDPDWTRLLVMAADRETLDPAGRRTIVVDETLMVRGWIRRDKAS